MGWTCEFCGKESKDRASSRSLAVHQQFSKSCLEAQGKENGGSGNITVSNNLDNPKGAAKTLYCDGCNSEIPPDMQSEYDACPYCGEAF